VIPKIIAPNSQDFSCAQVSILPVHSRGIDKHYLTKAAKEAGGFALEKEIAELKPIPGHTVIHTLAVGDSERYGDNRNCDGFSREDNKRCHHRFRTQGHVFKDHANSDPALKTGDVIATAHNDVMDRIEALAALDNKKYAEELAGLEKGKDIPVSMGSLQQYDVCSLCKHQAKTAADHCEHIRDHLGEVTADGQKIFMENPDPGYFDLSTVWKPADRIGYTIRKVALELGPIGGHVLADRFGMSAMSHPKVATLRRLASIEKLSPAVARVVSTAPTDLDTENRKQLKQAVDAHGVDSVLDYLHSNGFVLSPRDFAEVILGAPKLAAAAAPGVPALLADGFNRILGHGDLGVSMDGTPAAVPIKIAEELHGSLRENCSMHADQAARRSLVSSLGRNVGFGVVKVSAALQDPTATTGLAELYLRYKLACASHPANRAADPLLRTLVQSNVLS